MNKDKLQELLAKISEAQGFYHMGWATLSRPLSMDIYHQWLEDKKHGEMNYLATHAPIKENPQLQWPLMRSAFVVAVPYFPHPHSAQFKIKTSRVCLYASGDDYHYWFKQQLEKASASLKEIFPEAIFYCATDNTPILERDLAHRAGLGWVGKNSCLIHPKKGSLFLLGEILTDLAFESQADALPDFCGKCRRCIESCPTQAIEENRTLDAKKCISYWTIESRQVPPEPLREKFGDHLFGCDICQTVCPWNQKIFKDTLETKTIRHYNANQTAELIQELNYILLSSGKQLERDFKSTPLARAGQFGLRRNAMIVIANLKLKNCYEAVLAYINHEKLGELARWTLKKLET
ncbi:MAG: tRNA epoxyqueuosine(34) reductase QueG [Bdellovibrionia bacterium]